MARKARKDGARPAISQSKLATLIRSARSTKADVAEITGNFGAEIKKAVDDNYLNKKVFRAIVALDRLEPEVLKVWLEDFEHYLDISGLRERAESAPALDFEEDNVKPFPAPTSVAAE